MSDAPLDVRLLAQEQIPEGVFPGSPGEDLRVYLAPAPHEQAWQHALRDRSVEVCGVLVGTWKRDAAGPFVEVQHIIESSAARSGPAEVTFTHDTWAAINREMDTRYQNLRIVGWYHTHPDFGIFLSDYDVFIHRHFFAGAGQIAWVIDPIRDQEGVFRWRDNHPLLTPQFWVGSNMRPAPPSPGAALPALATAASRPGPSSGTARARGLWAGLDWSALGQMAALVCVGGLLGQMYAAWSDSQRALNQRTALTLEFFQARLLRVGLEELTQSANQDLKKLAAGLRNLEAKGREAAGATPEPATDELATMRRDLHQLATKIELIDRRYALSPREQEQLARFLLTQTGGRAPSRTVPTREGSKTRSPANRGEATGTDSQAPAPTPTPTATPTPAGWGSDEPQASESHSPATADGSKTD